MLLLTNLGSAVYIPFTSVYISHLSAFKADASATAVVSDPPLPRVVTSPYSETPWKPATITTSLFFNSFKITFSSMEDILAEPWNSSVNIPAFCPVRLIAFTLFFLNDILINEAEIISPVDNN